jgi:hypothetical protein
MAIVEKALNFYSVPRITLARPALNAINQGKPLRRQLAVREALFEKRCNG